MSNSPLLEVQDVEVVFPVQGGQIKAVDQVSFTMVPGETLAIVGESGCGKTTLARAILGLQPLSSGQILVSGSRVQGVERGLAAKVGIVWQDPYASLDPRWTVHRTLEEPFRLLGRTSQIESLLREVGLELGLADRYPHQLSGGQRQRVAIARALALRPALIICDEPTAALDLSIRAQILNLLRDLQSNLSCAFLYISHDLTTVRFLADRVAVMYLGRIVELGSAEEVFSSPAHPYTQMLLDSAPTLETLGKLPGETQGELPDPRIRFDGCRFITRCPYRMHICETNDPPPLPAGESEPLHLAWCHLLDKERQPALDKQEAF